MSDKKAFIIIDLQKDYLWDKRKSMFTYDTQKLVGNVNKAIAAYKEKGYDIIGFWRILFRYHDCRISVDMYCR